MNRMERPEVNPCKNGQLIFDKGAKILNGEKIIFSINSVGKTGYSHAKSEFVKLPYTILKINSKWMKDLNHRPKTATTRRKVREKL